MKRVGIRANVHPLMEKNSLLAGMNGIMTILCVLTRLLAENLQLHVRTEGEQRVDTLYN